MPIWPETSSVKAGNLEKKSVTVIFPKGFFLLVQPVHHLTDKVIYAGGLCKK